MSVLAPARLIRKCENKHFTRIDCQRVWTWTGHAWQMGNSLYSPTATVDTRRGLRIALPYNAKCAQCGALFVSEREVRGHYAADIRCNAKCQDAHGTSCECSCGGLNHGTGLPDRELHTSAPVKARQQALLNGRKARRNSGDDDWLQALFDDAARESATPEGQARIKQGELDRAEAARRREAELAAPAAPSNACYRCGGQGRLSSFQHIKGGECFACHGTGIGSGEKRAPRPPKWMRHPGGRSLA